VTPQVLISIITINDRISRVKPASTGQTEVHLGHHLETEPTTPIDPLDQINTPLRSTLGQKHGQTPLKPWRRWMYSGPFVAFSKFHLNTSKSTNMKVAQFVEEHNFHVEWHFKFLVEKDEKRGQLPASPVHRNMASFKVWLQFMQNPLRKTP
jgi:hypothetical protein